jgi:hypothetical protein
VDPADAEADPGRAQPVGERERDRLAVARDHDPVHLGSVDEPLEDRFAGRRHRERFVQVGFDVVERVDAEDAALPARVGRLQHRGHAHLVERAVPLRQLPQRCEAGLRHARLGETAAHRHLVRHQMRRLAADARQPEALGDRRDRRHRAVGRHGEHAVDLQPADRFQHCVGIGVVDDSGDVCLGEPERIGIPVDGGDAQPELLRTLDRAPLVSARADEQDRSQGRRAMTA